MKRRNCVATKILLFGNEAASFFQKNN